MLLHVSCKQELKNNMNFIFVSVGILFFYQQKHLTSAFELPHGRGVNVCTLPKAVGPCKAAFQRWYFDQDTSKCKRFIYSGCAGNKNNFKSLEKCQSACPVSGVNVCTLPKVAGRCKAAFQRWYFDQDTTQCKRFIYGGCGGNKNNFETLGKCQSSCPGY